MTSWKNRFIIIWTGQLFSILSSSIAQFAIVLWISLKTESAEVLAFATIAALLPQIVIGPFAGVFVDRWSRKWTMIGADSFVALCSAVMAVLFYTDSMGMGSIYALLMLRSIGSAFHTPAMQSSVPLLAPASELTRIAGINQVIQSISMIGGPAIGAIMVVSFDMSVVMLLDVAGAFIACTSLLFVTIPNPPKDETVSAQNIFKDMRDGMNAILRNRGISWIMLSEILVTFFIMPIVVLLPLMTLKHFEGTAYHVSLIEIAFGVGTLAGGILIGIWNPKIRKVTMMCVSYVTIGAACFVCGLLPSTGFVIYAVMSVLQGIAIPFYAGPFTALLQTQIDDSFLGRVFALFQSISLLPSVIGLLATGFLADTFGIAIIFVVGGAATILTTGIMLFIPSVRKLEGKTAEAK